MKPTDAVFDAVLRTGVGAQLALYDGAMGESDDVFADPELAPIVVQLRAGMLAARRASP